MGIEINQNGWCHSRIVTNKQLRSRQIGKRIRIDRQLSQRTRPLQSLILPRRSGR